MGTHRRVVATILAGSLAAIPASSTAQQKVPRYPLDHACNAQHGFRPGNVQDEDEACRLAERTAESSPAVVVSGGISLGAYQAGFIAMLVRYWSVTRRYQGEDLGDPLPRVWTGASAGAVNALLGGLSSCDPRFESETWSPESSLFWKVWVERLDLTTLVPWEDEDRTDHLFSQSHVEETLRFVEEEAARTPLRAGCSFGLGSTVTNLSGRGVPFGDQEGPAQAELRKVTESVVVQARVRDDGQIEIRLPFLAAPGDGSPFLQVTPEEFVYYPALDTRPTGTGGQTVPLHALTRAIQASAAFPLAFSPVDVRLSFFHPPQWQDPSSVRFVDGGFLNNNPLNIAARMGQRWRASENGEPGFDIERFPIVYLDQDFVDWKWKTEPPASNPTPLQKSYLEHAGTLLAGAQDTTVLDALENDPKLSGRVKIPRRSSVLPSEFRFAMMGFVDQKFREHDFYAGMRDALRFLRTQFRSTPAVRDPVRFPGLTADLSNSDVGVLSAGFNCVAHGYCNALPQLDALRKASRTLTEMAKAGTLREDDVDEFLKTLGTAGYRYSKNSVLEGAFSNGDRSDLVPVRNRLGRALHDLVSNQSGISKIVLRPAGAAFLDNWLTYSPPRFALQFGYGRQRGIITGIEWPFRAAESGRENEAYSRTELRFGFQLAGLGTREADQIPDSPVRIRWVTAGPFLDWVSDMDGFGGRVRWLQFGPYVRWRAGIGASASYLSDPDEIQVQPELRLGFDLVEMLGFRIVLPVYQAFIPLPEGPVRQGTPKFFRELELSVEGHVTFW
ncbi:MAG: patatin-like phospholipase family protein [Myxococcales bacterium]